MADIAFRHKRFNLCLWICDEMDRIAPDCPLTRELREDVIKCRTKEEYFALLVSKEAFRGRWYADDQDLRLPCEPWCEEAPSQQWRELAERHAAEIAGLEAAADDVAGVKRGLVTTRVTLASEAATLGGIVEYLGEISGFNIVLDARVHEGLSTQVPFAYHAREQILADTLSILAARFGLTWTVTEGKAVVMHAPGAEPDPILMVKWANEAQRRMDVGTACRE